MPSVLGSLARLWRERKAVTFAPGFWDALRPPAKSGATVNATPALECTTALACVQAIAMLPLDIYRPREGGGRDVAADEPLWDFFAGQPNEWQTWPEWIETTLMHAVLCCDGISFIHRPNPRGPIRELIPLVPGGVSIEQRQGYDFAYHLVLADGCSLTVGREQVFHLRAPSRNAYSGLDATKLAREAIGLALATEEAHARLHANGARPGGILTTEQRLTREQADELRGAWQQTQGGLSNAMRTAVLSLGLKWEPMGMTGVDAQHIETRRFQIDEICRAFGLYPAQPRFVLGRGDHPPCRSREMLPGDPRLAAELSVNASRLISRSTLLDRRGERAPCLAATRAMKATRVIPVAWLGAAVAASACCPTGSICPSSRWATSPRGACRARPGASATGPETRRLS